MARDARPAPFPFPVPVPPPPPLRTTPFPPPPLPAAADETSSLMARRVGGIPLPFFFAIGAGLGILLAVTVLGLLRL